MPTSSIAWRRLDAPGHDHCSLTQTADGWVLEGQADFTLEAERASIHYRVGCELGFATRTASLRGTLGPRAITFDIERTDVGWCSNGAFVAGLEKCVDLDLSFTPATNVLPLRRLRFAEGQRVSVIAAWFDLSRCVLEPLPQSYESLGSGQYRYESPTHGYAARLVVDPNGFVTDYPGLWRAVEGARG